MIAYIEEISVEDITRIYIKEVFIRYRALSKIILDSVGTNLMVVSRV